MGFRYRKSVKIGPVRLNASKSGLGWSVGSKGVRYTKKAGGGSRTTISAPGTGLSWVEEASSKKQQQSKTVENVSHNSKSTDPKNSPWSIYPAKMRKQAKVSSITFIVLFLLFFFAPAILILPLVITGIYTISRFVKMAIYQSKHKDEFTTNDVKPIVEASQNTITTTSIAENSEANTTPFEKELISIRYDLEHRYSKAEMDDFFERNGGQEPSYNKAGVAVMLWWLSKNNPVTGYVPSYFYFNYGMHFTEEVLKLNKLGLLNEFQLTEDGVKYLASHSNDVDNHRDPDGSKRASKQNAAIYEPSGEIDLNKVKFVDFDRLSDKKFQKGLSLLEIAKQLSKEKEYEKALHASYEAMMIGYLTPAIFKRAAISARGMKDYNLEKEILILADKMTAQQFVRDSGSTAVYQRPEWIQNRMDRVEQLLLKQK